MLRSCERLCRCGCGQIIHLPSGGYVYKEGVQRNSYYASKWHLPISREIIDWALETKIYIEVETKEGSEKNEK